MRKFLVICLLLICFIPISVFASDNETLGDLKKKYQDLLAEQQENENKTEEAKAQIAAKEAAILQAEKDIADAEAESEEAQTKIDESNTKIEELTKEVESILLYTQQMQGQNAYVEYISGASSMTEMIMRIEAVSQITDYIQETTEALKAEIEENEQLKIELEEKTVKLNAQIESYETTISTYYDNIEEYDAFAEDIDDKVAAAKTLYETTKKTCIANLGEENVSDSTLVSDCSKVPVNASWLKPLTSGRITSLIGYRTHPVTGRVYTFHNGMDIGGNAEGTPVYAAAAGEVVAVYYHQSCGGNKVYIYSYVDGKYYTHFYYHLLYYTVKVGDIVDTNTIIGYVGGGSGTPWDSCSTGAHLHFGIASGKHTSSTNSVLTQLPGFGNYVGYRWTSRTAYYTN